MGSVIDYIECPNCKSEAYSDFYYKTGEEYIGCSSCGYHRSIFIKEKSRGKLLKELTDDDFEIVEVKNPYGHYMVKPKDSVIRECGTLATEEEAKDFIEQMKSNKYVDTAQISRFIDGEIKVIEVV